MSSATRAAGSLVLASLVATAAAAQGARTQFGAGASLTFPMGDFHANAIGDAFRMGWQGIALLEVRPRGSPVGFGVDGTYGENSSNDKFNADVSAIVGAPTTAKFKQLGGTANVVYHFRPSSGGMAGDPLNGVRGYSVTLAGTFRRTDAPTSVTPLVSEILLGPHLSAGVGR